MHRYGSQAAWPCDSSSSRVPLVAERIQYKLCLLVHKSLLGHTPEYISDLLTSVAMVDLHCVLHRVATSSCRGHVDELATVPFLFLHREQNAGYTDGAETAAVDGLVSSLSENIFVSFCLRAPGYWLILWCVLGLLVGAQYKCLSYSYSYSSCHLAPTYHDH